MKYCVYKTRFINEKLKKAWKELENTDGTTPFLYFDFMKYVVLQSRFLSFNIPVFYYIENQRGDIVMIAPMKKNIFSGKIDTLGNLGFCDFTDFLYSHKLSWEERKECVLSLKSFIGKPFFLSRLCGDSETLQYLSGQFEILSTGEAVNIELPSDYDTHFKSLSKSVRQNIRTAYNRLAKNEKSFLFHFFIDAKNIPSTVKTETKRCYLERQLDKYSNGLSFFSRLKHKLVVSALRHDNYSLYKNENAINASLYIDGKIAAFFAGFLNKKEDRIVIPRLAVDSSFKFFSPGYILLCESIKYLIDNSNVRNLDLCLGSEKYKTDMGGHKYDTITVKVN